MATHTGLTFAVFNYKPTEPLMQDFEPSPDRGLFADPKKTPLFPSASKVDDLTPWIGTELHGLQSNQLTNAQRDELALLVRQGLGKIHRLKGQDQGDVLDANNNVDFSEIWVKARPFTAGLTIKYDDSPLTRAQGSLQSRAKYLRVGMRLPSAQVIRFCDAVEMQFLKAFPSDGRWRIVVFAGDVRQIAASRRLQQLGKYLFSTQGPIEKYTPLGADIDSFIEVIVLLSGESLTTKQEQIPQVFCPEVDKWRVRDLHEIYIDDESYHSGHGHAYELYGVSPKNGAIAIVRPDGYVSMVLDLEDYAGVSDFFAGFAVERRPAATNGMMNRMGNGMTNGMANEMANSMGDGVASH